MSALPDRCGLAPLLSAPSSVLVAHGQWFSVQGPIAFSGCGATLEAFSSCDAFEPEGLIRLHCGGRWSKLILDVDEEQSGGHTFIRYLASDAAKGTLQLRPSIPNVSPQVTPARRQLSASSALQLTGWRKVSDEPISFELKKLVDYVPFNAFNVSMQLEGLEDAQGLAPWEAIAAADASWLHLPEPSGVLGRLVQFGSAKLLLEADARGLAAAAEPYLSSFTFRVGLPAEHGGGSIIRTFGVALHVSATPVAEHSTIVSEWAPGGSPIDDYTEGGSGDDFAQASSRTIANATTFTNRPHVFSFVARDLEGLTINDRSHSFGARAGKCLNGICPSLDAFRALWASPDSDDNFRCCREPAAERVRMGCSAELRATVQCDYDWAAANSVVSISGTTVDGRIQSFWYRVTTNLAQPIGNYRVLVISNEDVSVVPFDVTISGKCPDGQYENTIANECVPCPPEAPCEFAAQITLADLDLQPNHWRLSERTTDIVQCLPDMAYATANFRTPCVGGNFSGGYCLPQMTGPRCSVCLAPGFYLDKVTATCRPCVLKGANTLLVPIGVVTGILCLLYPLFRLWRETRRDKWDTIFVAVYFDAFKQIVSRLGLVSKAKALVAFYQVVSEMPEVFDVPLPAEYLEIMSNTFGLFSFDWLYLFGPPECTGSFTTRLLVKALAPLFALLVLVMGSVVISAVVATGRCRDISDHAALKDAALHGALRALPIVLVLLFALVPSVCSRIFSTFNCESFGYDDAKGETRGFLFADPSVECYTGEWAHLMVLTGWLILIWPLGVPALFLALLIGSRRRAPWAPALSRSVSFLHLEYKEEQFYWELLESMRKLVLTGFLLILPLRFAFLRLILAILITVTHSVLLQAARPYKQESSAFFALLVSLALFCTLFAALLVKVFEWVPPAYIEDAFGFDSAFPLTVLILVFNFGAVVVGMLLFMIQLKLDRREQATRRLRYTGRRDQVPLSACPKRPP